MRLMRALEVPAREGDQVYRHSSGWAALGALTLAAASAALAWAGWKHGAILAYYGAAVLVVTLLLMRRLVTARFRPSNWLLRSSHGGLYVKFRSYLNYHFPADDATVAFIPYGEIRSARLVRYRDMLPDDEGAYSQVNSGALVELELTSPAESLSAAVAAEIARRGPTERRWFGSSSTRYNHAPVRMPSPGLLLLEWRVVPSAKVFLEAMTVHTNIATPESRSRHYGELNALSREQQEERLLELAQAGRKIDAIKVARELYGYDLTQAHAFVEGLLRPR